MKRAPGPHRCEPVTLPSLPGESVSCRICNQEMVLSEISWKPGPYDLRIKVHRFSLAGVSA